MHLPAVDLCNNWLIQSCYQALGKGSGWLTQICMLSFSARTGTSITPISSSIFLSGEWDYLPYDGTGSGRSRCTDMVDRQVSVMLGGHCWCNRDLCLESLWKWLAAWPMAWSMARLLLVLLTPPVHDLLLLPVCQN